MELLCKLNCKLEENYGLCKDWKYEQFVSSFESIPEMRTYHDLDVNTRFHTLWDGNHRDDRYHSCF